MRNKLEEHTLYVAPNPTGGSRCNLYLIPYRLDPAQSPKDLLLNSPEQGVYVGQIERDLSPKDRNFRVVMIEPELIGLKNDLEHTMGGNIHRVIQMENGLYMDKHDYEKQNKKERDNSPSP